MINRKLNDKQKKLVEDNHNLIYSYLKTNDLSMNDTEDWYGVAAIGLCHAALTYNEDKDVKFSTYAYVCIHHEITHAFRDHKRSIKDVLSLDDTDCFVEDISCCAALRDDYRFEHMLELQEAISHSYGALTEKKKEIIDLIINSGMSQTEIAIKKKLSRQWVNSVYREFINGIIEIV